MSISWLLKWVLILYDRDKHACKPSIYVLENGCLYVCISTWLENIIVQIENVNVCIEIVRKMCYFFGWSNRLKWKWSLLTQLWITEETFTILPCMPVCVAVSIIFSNSSSVNRKCPAEKYRLKWKIVHWRLLNGTERFRRKYFHLFLKKVCLLSFSNSSFFSTQCACIFYESGIPK